MPASKSRPQYGSIDISNTNIRPLVTISWQNTEEQQNVTHSLPYPIEIFIATYGHTAHLYIAKCNIVQCSPELMHGPIHSPQTSQFQFSPNSRGGMNWLVCRV